MTAVIKSLFYLWSLFCFATIAAAQTGTQTEPAPNPPGKILDVGALNIHIDCAGHGRPAFILLHGLGDYSFDWKLVQPAVANKTSTCAYDRPGQAWSSPGQPPRGVRTSAAELHALLKQANVPPPYVLAGHSWGGLIARMYAALYPKEVAGMVLVESTHEDEYLWLNGKVVRPRFMSDAEWSDFMKPKKPAPATAVSAPPKQPPSAPVVSRRRITKVPPPYDKLPEEIQRLRLWAMSQPWTPQRNEGGDSQDFRQDFLEMYRLRLKSEHPLGKMPLIVLTKTAGIDDDSDYTPDQLKWNRDLQDQLAALSLNSEHVIATHSGHHIQIDEPRLVIESILKVVDAVQHHRPLP